MNRSMASIGADPLFVVLFRVLSQPLLFWSGHKPQVHQRPKYIEQIVAQKMVHAKNHPK